MKIAAVLVFSISILLSPAAVRCVAAIPDGQLTLAIPFTIDPRWFDPSHGSGGQPTLILYALHDALVKPMPGKPLSPSLAESWMVSQDGRAYEFLLRPRLTFHNGDPVTAEDVKFSFDRYRGAGAEVLKRRVDVEIVDPRRVRFRVKEPWPDFLSVYASPLTSASWVVPKKYVEKVGDEGYWKAPVGAGPYKFVSFTPGVELLLEAVADYWRKTPSVRRLSFRSIPEEATRAASLKNGNVDIAFELGSNVVETVSRTPGLRVVAPPAVSTLWIDFTAEQWNTRSPWQDRRIRQAVAHAIDRRSLAQTHTLGYAKPAATVIPSTFEFAWAAPPIAYDPPLSKRLLDEAGYRNGFDGGDYFYETGWSAGVAESIVNHLSAVGIRTRLRPLERANFYAGWRDKKLTGLLQAGSAQLGNAATRIESHMMPQGRWAFGSYPEIETLATQAQRETDPQRRQARLHDIQRVAHEKVMFVPIWEYASVHGVGPKVGAPGIGLVALLQYSAPYEDLRLKDQRESPLRSVGQGGPTWAGPPPRPIAVPAPTPAAPPHPATPGVDRMPSNTESGGATVIALGPTSGTDRSSLSTEAVGYLGNVQTDMAGLNAIRKFTGSDASKRCTAAVVKVLDLRKRSKEFTQFTGIDPVNAFIDISEHEAECGTADLSRIPEAVLARVGVLHHPSVRPNFFCSAVLVAPDLVLTAHHCLFTTEGKPLDDLASLKFHSAINPGVAVTIDIAKARAPGPSLTTYPKNDIVDYVVLPLKQSALGGSVPRLVDRAPQLAELLVTAGLPRSSYYKRDVARDILARPGVSQRLSEAQRRDAEGLAEGVEQREGARFLRRLLRVDTLPTCAAIPRADGTCLLHSCQTDAGMSGAPLFGRSATEGSLQLVGIQVRNFERGHTSSGCGLPGATRLSDVPNAAIRVGAEVRQLLK